MQLALLIVIALSAIAVFGLNWGGSESSEPTATENWRWTLRKRRLQRQWQYGISRQTLPSLRWLGLLIVTVLTITLVQFSLPNFKLTSIAELKHAGDATVLLAIIGAPIAYCIWWFRDANNRQQIENQRKDVNLKDFQRLAEWAAGLHLPENKITENKKETNKETSKAKEATNKTEIEQVSESSETLESYIAPKGVIATPSRRDGAASLQIAAIYQLQAFLQGDYGKAFQRPAFQLLKSIWLALVNPHLEALNEIFVRKWDYANPDEAEELRQLMRAWQQQIRRTMNEPIGLAINVALGAQQGWLLRTHAVDLPNAVLTGYNSLLAALKQPLELDGLNLTGMQLQGAVFQESNLQRADLERAKLQGADLSWSDLQDANFWRAHLMCADLTMSNLQDANFAFAYLQGADLSSATLQRASFRRANLQAADLIGANLQGTNLSEAHLQGADLSGANLQDADLIGIKTNAHTVFDYCETNMSTQVIVYARVAVISHIQTFALRERLRDENGLHLPDILYQQLFAEPTEYSVLNDNQVVERYDVGLRQP